MRFFLKIGSKFAFCSKIGSKFIATFCSKIGPKISNILSMADEVTISAKRSKLVVYWADLFFIFITFFSTRKRGKWKNHCRTNWQKLWHQFRPFSFLVFLLHQSQVVIIVCSGQRNTCILRRLLCTFWPEWPHQVLK